MTTWRSAPSRIFSIASVKSGCSTFACSWRAAERAAPFASRAMAGPGGAGGEEGGLVDEQRDVGAGRAGDRGRDLLQVHAVRQRHAACVDLEDLDPTGLVGRVDRDAPVVAARAQQSRVEDLGAVGRAEDD